MRVSGLRCWVEGLGFKVSGSVFQVLGLGFEVMGLGLGVQGFRFWGSGLGDSKPHTCLRLRELLRTKPTTGFEYLPILWSFTPCVLMV